MANARRRIPQSGSWDVRDAQRTTRSRTMSMITNTAAELHNGRDAFTRSPAMHAAIAAMDAAITAMETANEAQLRMIDKVIAANVIALELFNRDDHE